MPHWLYVLLSMSGTWILLGLVVIAIIYERLATKEYRGRSDLFSTEKRDKAGVHKITYLLVSLGFSAGFVGVLFRTPHGVMLYVLIGLYGGAVALFSRYAWQAAKEEKHWDSRVKDS